MKSYATNKYNIGDKVFYKKELSNPEKICIRLDIIKFIDFYEDSIVYTLSEGITKSHKSLFSTYEKAYENY